MGRFELRQADLREGGPGLLDMPLCVEPARRGRGGGGKSSAGAIQAALAQATGGAVMVLDEE